MNTRKACTAAVCAWIVWAAGAQARVYTVDQQAKNAGDDNPGTSELPLRTIAAAARLAGPGDTVLVQPGVYRERITPARGGEESRPVVYQAALSGKTIIRGSEIWTPTWEEDAANPGVYTAAIDDALFGEQNPFRTGLSIASNDLEPKARPAFGNIMPYTLGQVFVDGEPMVQSLTVRTVKATPGSWIVSGNGKRLVMHFPPGLRPDGCLVEIATRNRVFCPRKRGLGHIQVRGFVFEHCANQGPFPQGGMVSVRSGHHWVIEDNVIRFAKTVGLDCGSETWKVSELKDTLEEDRKLVIGGQHVIRNNVITDNGLCGIAGWNHKGTKILGNRIERNNRLTITKAEAQWEEWGAIKLHASDALIEGNLIRDNNCYGIWIDNGYHNARITRNVVIGNRGAGVFLELGAGGCLIDNNVIARTTELGTFYPGFGVYAHDAADVTVAHNLITGNAGAGVLMRKVSNRDFGGKPAQPSNENILNNIIVNNGLAVGMPFPYQYSRNCRSDWNALAGNEKILFNLIYSVGQPKREDIVRAVQAKAGADLQDPASAWQATGLLSLDLWKAVTGWEANSAMLDNKQCRFNLKASECSLRVDLGTDQLLNMTCPPVEGVEADFNGKPLKKSGLIPGPFQDLDVDTNYYLLWPRR